MKQANVHELSEPGCFCLSGKAVSISYQGRTHKFKLSKGMRHLAALLYHCELPLKPEQLELYEHRVILDKSLRLGFEERSEHEFSLSSDFPPYEMADRATLIAVKKRLIQLIDEIAEADSWNDYSRKDDLESEKDRLMAYLKEVYRPGGKLRYFPTERSLQRKRIRKSLSRAMDEIKAADPELAMHLDASLYLDEYFVYRPRGYALEVMGY